MSRFGIQLAYKVFSPIKLPLLGGIQHTKTQNIKSVKASNKRNYPPILLLHGIANSKETWDDCGQAIANRTGTKVYSLDARDHGDSKWTDKFGYMSMVDDLECFMDSMRLPTSIIIGHSMGGKTAMCYAIRNPDRVHSMIIEDMTMNIPLSIEDSLRHYIAHLREVLHKIPLNAHLLEAKRIVARCLFPALVTNETWSGRDLPLLLKNGSYEWKINLEVVQRSLGRQNFTPQDLLKGTEREGREPVYKGPVLLVYSTRSPMPVIKDKQRFLKLFPNTIYEGVEGADHFIHISHRDVFIELVTDFILKHRHLKPRL